MGRGFVHQTAVMDVYSRVILAHSLAITLEAVHAKAVVQEALNRYGRPEIINTDKGRSFTVQEFVYAVLHSGAKF